MKLHGRVYLTAWRTAASSKVSKRKTLYRIRGHSGLACKTVLGWDVHPPRLSQACHDRPEPVALLGVVQHNEHLWAIGMPHQALSDVDLEVVAKCEQEDAEQDDNDAADVSWRNFLRSFQHQGCTKPTESCKSQCRRSLSKACHASQQ